MSKNTVIEYTTAMSSQTTALQVYVYFNVETLRAALSGMDVTCDSSIFRHCSFVFGAPVVCKNCSSHQSC